MLDLFLSYVPALTAALACGCLGLVLLGLELIDSGNEPWLVESARLFRVTALFLPFVAAIGAFLLVGARGTLASVLLVIGSVVLGMVASGVTYDVGDEVAKRNRGWPLPAVLGAVLGPVVGAVIAVALAWWAPSALGVGPALAIVGVSFVAVIAWLVRTAASKGGPLRPSAYAVLGPVTVDGQEIAFRLATMGLGEDAWQLVWTGPPWDHATGEVAFRAGSGFGEFSGRGQLEPWTERIDNGLVPRLTFANWIASAKETEMAWTIHGPNRDLKLEGRPIHVY